MNLITNKAVFNALNVIELSFTILFQKYFLIFVKFVKIYGLTELNLRQSICAIIDTIYGHLISYKILRYFGFSSILVFYSFQVRQESKPIADLNSYFENIKLQIDVTQFFHLCQSKSLFASNSKLGRPPFTQTPTLFGSPALKTKLSAEVCTNTQFIK